MSNQTSTMVGKEKDQVMVSLPDIYEAAESATINGAVAFRDFYEIIRLNYPELPQWPEEEAELAAQNARPHSEESDTQASTTTVHRTNSIPSSDYADDGDEVPIDLLIERRPPLKRSTNTNSSTPATTTRNRQGGPQHSAGPSTGYVDILTPIVEKLEEDLHRLNLKRYEKEGFAPRETWVPPRVEPGSPDSARGSYSRYYEYISSKDLEQRRDDGDDGDDDDDDDDVRKEGE